MLVLEREARSIINKSNLPGADYVINPYSGCLHACVYCYAAFMRRFLKVDEEWGKFVIVKNSWTNNFQPEKYRGKRIVIGSVTDPYQPIERKFRITRKILKYFYKNKDVSSVEVEIITKSHLVLDDLDLFRNIPNIRIGVSIGMLDDNFRKAVEPFASSVEKRLKVLETLKQNKIRNYLFISPIFPSITPINELLGLTSSIVDYYLFENLTLRTLYKTKFYRILKKTHPDLVGLYDEIYNSKTLLDYWKSVKNSLENKASESKRDFRIYFKH